jgi:hypothetical protein
MSWPEAVETVGVAWAVVWLIVALARAILGGE